MRSTRILVVGLAAALGCGGSEASSNFTSCQQDSTCRPNFCTLVEDCLVDKCEYEYSYQFAGEEYESTCTYGPRKTTTTYPLDGGPGTARLEQNLQQCFYEAEVQFFDYDQTAKCTQMRSCTLQQLSCEPSTQGDPDCSVVSETPC